MVSLANWTFHRNERPFTQESLRFWKHHYFALYLHKITTRAGIKSHDMNEVANKNSRLSTSQKAVI